MGVISELAEWFKDNVKPWETVYEYQQGLKYRFGRVIEIRIRPSPEEKIDFKKQEKEMFDKTGKYLNYIPFLDRSDYKYKLPEGWKRSLVIAGYPKHPDRFKKSKLLSPGLYFYVPVLYDIVTGSVQDRPLDLKNVSVFTQEGQKVFVSCNVNYNILNFYKAYNNVHEYEDSLKTQTLSILAKYSRDLSFDDWKSKEKIKDLEEKVVDELKKTATSEWGLKIQALYITECLPHEVHRIFHEGVFPIPHNSPVV